MNSTFHFHKFDNTNSNLNQTSKSNNIILVDDPNGKTNSNFFMSYNMSQSNAFKQSYNNTSKNDFLNEILKINFKNEIENNNIEKIQPFLFNMINNYFGDYEEDFPYLVSHFQKILRYLYDIQLGLVDKNNQLEKIIEEKDKKLNLIKDNQIRINKLQEQINKTTQIEMKYKLLLKNNNKKIPGSIDENTKFYVCDVCKNKKFNNYELFHKHYVKCHIDPNLDNGVNIAMMNNTFNKVYFDNQINELTNELNLTLSKMNDNKNEDINENKNVDFLNKNNNFEESIQNQNKNITLKSSKIFNNPRKNYRGEVIYNTELQKKIKRVQELQNEKFDNFLSQFNIFRDMVYNELNKYSKKLNKNIEKKK